MVQLKLTKSAGWHPELFLVGFGGLLALLGGPLAGAQGEEWPWEPPMAECMAEGGTRGDCIEALPPEVLAELEAWEAQNGVMRRAQMAVRSSLGQGGLVFGQVQPAPQHEATVMLQPTRLQVAVPEPVDEPFVMQIFEISVREKGETVRHMRAASEIHETAEEDAVIEIIRPYGDDFYFHAKYLQDLIYVRLIRTRSLTYRDYKPTLFDYRPTGDLFVDGYAKDHEILSSYVSDDFSPISRSKSFTIRIVREQDPDFLSNRDYSQNLGFVEGIPPGFSRSLPLDTPLGWHYQVDGIYFTESGAERYIFKMYAVDAAGQIRYPYGGRAITIDFLRERSFLVDEVDYAGD